MRRVRDVPLLRDNQPLFALSWSVIHRIDEESPFFGISERSEADASDRQILALIATMTGFDGTYSQTIHARHIWYPEDVRWNEHFVDVLSELEDGRLSVDYREFHRTVLD